MKAPEKKTYPAKILSIKKANLVGEIQEILVQEEGTGRVQKYDAYDVLFLTTHEKIIERHCMITENTKQELVKIMLDDTKEVLGIEPKLVYRFDKELLNTYVRTSLLPIYEVLRKEHLAKLNQIESRQYFMELIQKLPNYVLDQGHLHEFKKALLENPEHVITPEDSEKIHFFYYAHEAAKKCFILQKKKQYFQENASEVTLQFEENGEKKQIPMSENQYENIIGVFDTSYNLVIAENYSHYIGTAVSINNIISDHIMEQYIEVFMGDIENQQAGITTSIKEQKTNFMYANLDPLYKYHCFDDTIKAPLSKIEYSYLHTLFVAQNIYKTYSSDEYFAEMLAMLLKLVHKTYPNGLRTIEKKDSDILYLHEDLYEYDVFGPDGQVEIILHEAFDHLIAEAYYEYSEKMPTPSFSLIDKIHEKIMLGMSGGVENERRLYYTVFMLEKIHEVTLANKNQNTI